MNNSGYHGHYHSILELKLRTKTLNTQGLILAVTAYCIWGFFPLYYGYLDTVLSVEVLAQRIIWSLITTLIIGHLLKRWQHLFSALHSRVIMSWLGLSAVLIGINWLVYIWAVANNKVLEASLGYFISPVVSLILARMFFKERLHRLQIYAALIAIIAIIWELVALGQLPWVSLILSLAFSLYGVVRKHCNVDGISGMTIETIYLLPFALIWIYSQTNSLKSQLVFSNDIVLSALLIGAGILSAIPLILFAMATRRVDLSIIGFIMYINPTLQFLIGIFILKEPYPPERLITFVLIWIALLFFSAGLVRMRKEG